MTSMFFLSSLLTMLLMRRIAATYLPTTTRSTAFVPPTKRTSLVDNVGTTLSSSSLACSATKQATVTNKVQTKQRCDILLFDLDGTLYDGDNGMKEFMQNRIHQFLVDKTSQETGDLKFDSITTLQEARAVWEPLFAKYNQSLRGLLSAGYKIDAVEFNKYFRDGTENFMVPDERLRSVLQSLPQQKVIFTNAPEASAIKNMDRMGILDCFDAVYGAETMGTGCCKPEMEAFEKVLSKVGINAHDPQSCSKVCFFEDSYMNLVQGKEMGMHTVFLHCSTTEEEGKSKGEADELFDAVIANVGEELGGALPWLWDTDATQQINSHRT